MKVIPVASPHAMPAASTQTDSRSRAIAAFNKAAAQGTAGVNPNAVQPEEIRAVTAPTPKETTTETPTETLEAQTTSTTNEAPVEETTETQEQDPALARQFAQLARQEKALQAKRLQQEQAIKAKEAELAAREAKALAIEQQYKSGYISQEQLRQNALQALADAGVSYDELTQQILNSQPVDPRLQATIQKLEAKNQELEEKLKSFDTKIEEQSKQSYQAALNQIRYDAEELVANDPAYEMIKATNSVDDVVEYIEKQYQKHGRVISVEQAAEKIENYLVEQISKIATGTNKIKQRLSQAQAGATKETKQTQPPAAKDEQTQPGMKTLTNAAASARKLTAKERAILAFKGELKS